MRDFWKKLDWFERCVLIFCVVLIVHGCSGCDAHLIIDSRPSEQK